MFLASNQNHLKIFQGTPPFFRDFHTATVYLDRYMLVFGGRGDHHGPFHTRSEKYCNILVIFDVDRQEWIRPKTMGDTPGLNRITILYINDRRRQIIMK